VSGIGRVSYSPGEPQSYQLGIDEDIANIAIAQLAAIAVGIRDVPLQADCPAGDERAVGQLASRP
jgi:hypothetical protein